MLSLRELESINMALGTKLGKVWATASGDESLWIRRIQDVEARTASRGGIHGMIGDDEGGAGDDRGA